MKVIIKIEIPDALAETIANEFELINSDKPGNAKTEKRKEELVNKITAKIGLRIKTELRVRFFNLIMAAQKNDKSKKEKE